MERPYLKKLTEIEDFAVWEVNGEYVRNYLNREFTNFGQHYRFSFIPTYEFWVDKENSRGEAHFFVDHMLIEWHLMREGRSYDFAIEVADKEEKKERRKSEILHKVIDSRPHIYDVVPQEVYRQKVKNYDYPDIWVISGELVRDMYFIDFTEGGHHFVYNFVPYHEVWIDDDLKPEERKFVLLHELHERYLMYKGSDYSKAHHSSSIIEYKCRKEPDLTKENIDNEAWLNMETAHRIRN